MAKQPEAPAAEPQEQMAAGLTIQDLSTALQIIQVVQQRGAIKPDEMVIVGSLYAKLHSFLEASGALAPQGQQTVAPASNETPDDKKAPVKEPAIGEK